MLESKDKDLACPVDSFSKKEKIEWINFLMEKVGLADWKTHKPSELSGGQRQKLAISRAMILNPRILIFDEATSALDALSEKEVLAHIERVRQGRTVLMIAHRLSTVRKADMILVMKEGSIVEYGTHQQLLQKGGMYAAMYREQEGTAEGGGQHV